MEKRQNVFASFLRLRDFPLDLTSVYETLELANRYVENNKTAYPGQVIAVYGSTTKDNSDEIGIYIIVDQNGKLGLQKSANDSDLQALKSQIDSEVKEKLDTLEGKVNGILEKVDLDADEITNIKTTIESLKTEIGKISETIIPDLKETFATKEELTNQKTEIEADVDSKISEVNKTIDEKESALKTETEKLNKRIDAILGADSSELDEALDSIKEISDWINAHEKFVEAIYNNKEKLDKLEIQVKENKDDISNLKTSVDDINSRVTSIEGSYISGEDVSNLIKNTVGIIEKDINLSGAGESMALSEIPAGSIITEYIIEISTASVATFLSAGIIETVENPNSYTFISNNIDDDSVSFINTEESGTYIYNINYKCENSVRPTCTINIANDAVFNGKIIVKYQKVQ